MRKTIEHYNNFNPRAYLSAYYSNVDGENRELLNFLAEATQYIRGSQLKLIDLGSGPCIYSVISLSQKCSSIVLSDFLYQNLIELEDWKFKTSNCYDWDSFFEVAFIQESGKDMDYPNMIGKREERKDLIRRKLEVVNIDVVSDDGYFERNAHDFDIVQSMFGLESMAVPRTIETWKELMRKAIQLLKPGGSLILGTLGGSNGCYLGDFQYASTFITEAILVATLQELECDKNLGIRSIPALSYEEVGYQRLLLSVSQKA